MYTLKGIFPEPKKQQKKNFIQENMKQLKCIQGKSPKETPQGNKGVPLRIPKQPNATHSLGKVKSSPSNKTGKASLTVGKNVSNNPRKKYPEVRIKKGDMAEFLQRKELRHSKTVKDEETDEELQSTDSSNYLKDIGCQTIESNLSDKLAECTKLTMLYPKKDEEEAKLKASGDSGLHHKTLTSPKQRHRTGEEPNIDSARNHSRLNAILERKDHKQDNKDPYLPSGYQKGVVPAYLRSRKGDVAAGGAGGAGCAGSAGAGGAEDEVCPPGHVALPDTERKETLRMLRNSFAELVSELNKMPVKTDTLRMRNRKMELEKQLTKLEEGIKVFSRPKVFVKIGE